MMDHESSSLDIGLQDFCSLSLTQPRFGLVNVAQRTSNEGCEGEELYREQSR